MKARRWPAVVVVALVLAVGGPALGLAGVSSQAPETHAGETSSAVATLSVESAGRFAPQHHRWNAPGSEISASWSEDGEGVRIDLVDDHGVGEVAVAAPPGEQLEPGRYTYATALSDPERRTAGLSVSLAGDRCRWLVGSFEVHELEPDLSRAWITYEQRCGISEPAVFGEVRLGYEQPALQVSASRVDWPDEEPGASGIAVPLVVSATGAADPELELDLTGDPAFGILAEDCSGGAAQQCAVYLTFAPPTAGDHSAALTVRGGSTTRTVELYGRGRPGTSYLELGRTLGTWHYTTGDADLVAVGDASAVYAKTRVDSSHTTLEDRSSLELQLWAPGEGLQTGRTYVGLGAALTPGVPGVTLIGAEAGCRGKVDLTVHEASYDDDGGLRSISVTLTCGDGHTAALAWQSDDPRRADPVTPVPLKPVHGLKADGHPGAVALSWGDAQSTDDTRVEVRVRGGGERRTIAGTAAGDAWVDGLLPSRGYRIDVVPLRGRGPDVETGPVQRVKVSGTRLSVSPQVTPSRKKFLVSGTLLRADGRPVEPQLQHTLRLAWQRGDGPWHERTVGIGRDGAWSSRLALPRRTRVQAFYEGSRLLDGALVTGATTDVVVLRRR